MLRVLCLIPCQLLLVLWKTILSCCGGIRDLARVKKLSRELAGLSSTPDDGMTFSNAHECDNYSILIQIYQSSRLLLILRHSIKKCLSNILRSPRVQAPSSLSLRIFHQELPFLLLDSQRRIALFLFVITIITRSPILSISATMFHMDSTLLRCMGAIALCHKLPPRHPPHLLRRNQRNNSIKQILRDRFCSHFHAEKIQQEKICSSRLPLRKLMPCTKDICM